MGRRPPVAEVAGSLLFPLQVITTRSQNGSLAPS